MGNAWNDESIKTPTNSQKDRVYANVAVERDVPVLWHAFWNAANIFHRAWCPS